MSLIFEYEEKGKLVSAQKTREFYMQLETELREERRNKRFKYTFEGDDEDEDEEEGDEKEAYYNRFMRGKGKGRGFYVDPSKRRGKVDI